MTRYQELAQAVTYWFHVRVEAPTFFQTFGQVRRKGGENGVARWRNENFSLSSVWNKRPAKMKVGEEHVDPYVFMQSFLVEENHNKTLENKPEHAAEVEEFKKKKAAVTKAFAAMKSAQKKWDKSVENMLKRFKVSLKLVFHQVRKIFLGERRESTITKLTLVHFCLHQFLRTRNEQIGSRTTKVILFGAKNSQAKYYSKLEKTRTSLCNGIQLQEWH